MAASSAPGRRTALSGRAFWALALTCLAVAGLYSSARASDQRAAWAASVDPSCNVRQVEWGYDMQLVPGSGYVIAGMHVDNVPAACAGAPIVIFYSGADGAVHSSPDVLVAGLVDTLDPAVLATIAGPDMTAGWTLG